MRRSMREAEVRNRRHFNFCGLNVLEAPLAAPHLRLRHSADEGCVSLEHARSNGVRNRHQARPSGPRKGAKKDEITTPNERESGCSLCCDIRGPDEPERTCAGPTTSEPRRTLPLS